MIPLDIPATRSALAHARDRIECACRHLRASHGSTDNGIGAGPCGGGPDDPTCQHLCDQFRPQPGTGTPQCARYGHGPMRTAAPERIHPRTDWCGTWWQCAQPECTITVLRPASAFWTWHARHAPSDHLYLAWRDVNLDEAQPGQPTITTVRATLTVPGRPPLRLAEQATGSTVTYRLGGHRARGALEIRPSYSNDTEALPSDVAIHLGISGAEWVHDSKRAELPEINGVTLHGHHLIHPPSYLLEPRPRRNFDRTGPGDIADATRLYFSAILAAILRHHSNRPQHDAELLAYATEHAGGRLANLRHGRITKCCKRLHDAQAELAELETAATHLALLASRHHEHDHTTSNDGQP